MFKRAFPRNICPECLCRRPFSKSAPTLEAQLSKPPPYPPSSGAAKLTNRRLVSVQGQDAPQFLHGITTKNVPGDQSPGLYSAFLTAQGRVLNDVFIYSAGHHPDYKKTLPQSHDTKDPGYLIEVDATEASKLHIYMQRYKVRSKVRIKVLDEDLFSVWSIWDDRQGNGGVASSPTLPSPSSTREIGCIDSRIPGMGRRLILPGTTRPSPTKDNAADVEEVDLRAYTVRRMLKGVPEGQSEIVREVALPHESNLDLMGAIDFTKGCYVGQELTIRTQHGGIVRKRILPAQLYRFDGPAPSELRYEYPRPSSADWARSSTPPLPPSGTKILRVGEQAGKSLGKWLVGVDNVGLALCRLQQMASKPQQDPSLEFMAEWLHQPQGAEEPAFERVKIKAFVPEWFPRKKGQSTKRGSDEE